MKNMKKVLSILLLLFLVVSLTGCGGSNSSVEKEPEIKGTLTMADAGWDSIRVHNAIASFILKHGYGYETEIVSGSSPVTFAGHRQGDIDIYMEVWTENFGDAYIEALDKGEILLMSTNFDDNAQGLYVPTFLVKGDSERGIEALAPDLVSITDLPKYWELFVDAENPDKGRIYGSPPGWAIDEILSVQMETFGLLDTFDYFRPGSDSALSASLVRAFEAGEPWVGYYWEPTWIMGRYDMTLLEAPEYNEEDWNNGYATEIPPIPVTVTINGETAKSVPEILDFLKNYQTSSALTSEALAYMMANETDAENAAIYFLKENQDLWLNWLPQEVSDKVLAALK